MSVTPVNYIMFLTLNEEDYLLRNMANKVGTVCNQQLPAISMGEERTVRDKAEAEDRLRLSTQTVCYPQDIGDFNIFKKATFTLERCCVQPPTCF